MLVADVAPDLDLGKGPVHPGDEGQGHPAEGGHDRVVADQEVGHPHVDQRKTKNVTAVKIGRRNEGGVKMRIVEKTTR